MKHDLDRILIYKFSGFIALLENYIMKDTKKINSCYYFCLFSSQHHLLPIMALNFHSAQQVSKNSLLHALVRQLKYLQIQNRWFLTEKSSPESWL